MLLGSRNLRKYQISAKISSIPIPTQKINNAYLDICVGECSSSKKKAHRPHCNVVPIDFEVTFTIAPFLLLLLF